jgi:phosphoglycolate phosphatase
VSNPKHSQDGLLEAVLFDLDGTLVDTAPDMVAVLQSMQAAYGVEPVSYERGRQQVSNGSIGLLRLGFPEVDIEIGHAYHSEFLDRYADVVCEKSRVFDGVDVLLDRLDEVALPWGVVTNKPEYLTAPLMQCLGLASRSACIVGGDTLPVRKPDPGPLLLACDMAGVAPHRTVYVGDAPRDIEAGLAAGMTTIAATYGYVPDEDDPHTWGADTIATTPEELTQFVLKAVNLGAR